MVKTVAQLLPGELHTDSKGGRFDIRSRPLENAPFRIGQKSCALFKTYMCRIQFGIEIWNLAWVYGCCYTLCLRTKNVLFDMYGRSDSSELPWVVFATRTQTSDFRLFLNRETQMAFVSMVRENRALWHIYLVLKCTD